MDKAHLIAQLVAQLQQTAAEARQAIADAAVEVREGATPNEKREDSRVALEQGDMARAQQARLARANGDLGLLDGFTPSGSHKSVALGSVVEVDSDDMGRTFFLAPAGAGIELTMPGGDGYLSVITPQSPFGRAVIGGVVGDVVEVKVGGELREWTISFIA